ncbi:MAG: hypothetical protein WKG00_34220 [Polyangiaceae bacterium]
MAHFQRPPYSAPIAGTSAVNVFHLLLELRVRVGERWGRAPGGGGLLIEGRDKLVLEALARDRHADHGPSTASREPR